MMGRVFTMMAAMFVFTLPLHAQDAAPRFSVATNPISLLFTVFNAEAQAVVSPNVTAGLSGTYWGHSEEDEASGSSGSVSYRSVDAKLRFYPGGALDGFAIGALIGMTHAGGAVVVCGADEPDCNEGSAGVNLPSFGVELDHDWLLGDRRNITVGLGIGGKRLIYTGAGEYDSILAYPFGRLTVGMAF